MPVICIIGIAAVEIALKSKNKSMGWEEDLVFIEEMDYLKTGSLLTTAFSLARLGIKSIPVGVVGDDELGHGILDEIRGVNMGIRGIRERAESIGGALQVISRPGSGTEISVTVKKNDNIEEKTEKDIG